MTSGGDSTLHTHAHNNMSSIQGGATNDNYHLTGTQHADLTDGNGTTLHTHAHNNMSDIQGGATNDTYHLTGTQHTDLTDGGDTSLHYHSSDRNRENHTGTQLSSTISDFNSAVDARVSTGIMNSTTSVSTKLYGGMSKYNSFYSLDGNDPDIYSYDTSVAINGDFYTNTEGQANGFGDYSFGSSYTDIPYQGNTIEIDPTKNYEITINDVYLTYVGEYASDYNTNIRLTTPVTICYRYREHNASNEYITPSTYVGDGMAKGNYWLYFKDSINSNSCVAITTTNAQIGNTVSYTTNDAGDTVRTLNVIVRYNITTHKLLIIFDSVVSCAHYIKVIKVGSMYQVTDPVVNGVTHPGYGYMSVTGWPDYYPLPSVGGTINAWYGETADPDIYGRTSNTSTYIGYSPTLGPNGGHIFGSSLGVGASYATAYIQTRGLFPYLMARANIIIMETSIT